MRLKYLAVAVLTLILVAYGLIAADLISHHRQTLQIRTIERIVETGVCAGKNQTECIAALEERLAKKLIVVPGVGEPGPPGRQGSVGSQGPKGATGVAGPKGDQGYTGPTGRRGPRGETGHTGTTGHTGDTGKAGKAGKPGAAGPVGPIGPQGAPGPAREPGSSVTTTVTIPGTDIPPSDVPPVPTRSTVTTTATTPAPTGQKRCPHPPCKKNKKKGSS